MVEMKDGEESMTVRVAGDEGRRDKARRTAVVRDQRYLNHIPGPMHVESPERLRVIYDRLDATDLQAVFAIVPPRLASREELGWNHTSTYIERIARTADRVFCQLDPDTATSAGSWEAACLAAGGIFSALDELDAGRIDNAFALVRPPGHHAEADHAMGFCLFNNVALGAHYARRVLGRERILIVDWDLHHGNGTQHSFYRDPRILYFSTHQFPHYPGTGCIHEVGEGPGKGFTVNVPLPPGVGDQGFVAIYRRILIPIVLAYRPELILVSAGFDAHRADPLGGMELSVQGFAYLARILVGLAAECCQGQILFCLEGGYNLGALKEGVLSVLQECRGTNILELAAEAVLENPGPAPTVVEQVLELQKAYWKGI